MLDEQRHVAESGETCLIREKFPRPGKDMGGRSPKFPPGSNQQAVWFVWWA
jgi:hypothetical protein